MDETKLDPESRAQLATIRAQSTADETKKEVAELRNQLGQTVKSITDLQDKLLARINSTDAEIDKIITKMATIAQNGAKTSVLPETKGNILDFIKNLLKRK